MLQSLFFRRLFLPYFLLFGAGIVGLALFAAALFHRAALEHERQVQRNESRLVYALVADDMRANRRAELRQKLQTLGAYLHGRITIVGVDGQVLADTSVDPERMDDHRLRPEIVAATSLGEGFSIRRSATLNQEMMYLATRAEGADGVPYYIRSGVFLDNLNQRLRAIDIALAVAAGLAILVAGAICYSVARRHASPVIELSGQGEALARGDVGRRSLPEKKGELGALARALNTVAESLGDMGSQAVRKQEELLTILSSMSEGVIATDAQQRIFLFNPAAASLLDFQADGAQGKALWEIVRDERILKAASEALNAGGRKTFSIGPIHDRHLGVSVCSFPSPGSAEGLVIVAHDTTKSIRYEELRKEFVANVSHELRTPLTVIKGFVETLREGAIHDPVKGPEYLVTIEKNVQQLSNLVHDLLELSRLEGRAEVHRRAAVDLGETVRKVIDLMTTAAVRKGQTLTADIAAGLPALLGDPDYLERAVANLVDNAIKYTPQMGTIRVSARADDSTVTIEVSDNGIGISPEDMPRIFERFYRVDKSRSRDMGGTGLGLSIVKHVVQAHGGSVEAIGEPGKGSTFRIILPV